MTVEEMVKAIKLSFYSHFYKKEVIREKELELDEAIDQAREAILLYRVALMHLLRPKEDDVISRNNKSTTKNLNSD